MIAQITEDTVYANNEKHILDRGLETAPVNNQPVYAHSVEDALNWLLAFPLHQGATVTKLENGIIVIDTDWLPCEPDIYDELFAPEHRASYQKCHATIRPVNTIYENRGFEGYREQE